MFLDVALGSKATWRILALLSESPGGRVTRPEIRRHTRLGNNAISKSLKDLTSHGILTFVRSQKRRYYQLDLTNEFVKRIVDLCVLERKSVNDLPYSYSLVLREYVRSVLAMAEPTRIILFGSVAKRTFREDSDIDVMVVFGRELPVQKKIDLEGMAHGLEGRFKRNIQQHFSAREEFDKSKSPLFDEVKKEGIDLI